MENLVLFGYRLKNLRKSKKMTAQNLADMLGIKKTSVYLWENGDNFPTYDKLLQLATFFEVSLDYLFGRTDDNWLYTKSFRNRLKLFIPFTNYQAFKDLMYSRENISSYEKGVIEQIANVDDWLTGAKIPSIHELNCLASLISTELDVILGLRDKYLTIIEHKNNQQILHWNILSVNPETGEWESRLEKEIVKNNTNFYE